MAEARQCDRCGELYPCTENKLPPIFLGFADNLEPFDLCEDCAANLIMWVIARNHGRAKLQERGIVERY